MTKKIVKKAPTKIMAIDPGNVESAYVVWDGCVIHSFGKVLNDEMLQLLESTVFDSVVIEQIKSYGMAVGESIFETCVWSGRFMQKVIHTVSVNRIPRQEIKLHICKSSKAKDANVIQALIDRFAGDVSNKGKGTKKDPGFFYGFAKDVWQAFAVAVTYYDKYINNEG